MITFSKLFKSSVVSFAILATGSAFAGGNLVLGGSGIVQQNDYSRQMPASFDAWCQGICFPNFKAAVQDPSSDVTVGTVYVWSKNITIIGDTFCLEVFDIIRLNNGSEIHTQSNPLGVCGVPLDSSVQPAIHLSEPGLKYSFVNDGIIVGGTKKYKKARGTYVDRFAAEIPFSVLMGMAPPAGNEYIDNFLWKLSFDDAHDDRD